ncbi:coiled-coil domain-containing protein 153 isoform X1 [Amblyraja radiata]|uniref:coiled-coil domain-containing protein 153 isoform X1 n=2 Tax=Amblyraja radiata TaxID=386614 RepID=UPI001401F5A5|nr:coiled-coil domain-containing protein 153 isoform X1 [Amblyraja radiata]
MLESLKVRFSPWKMPPKTKGKVKKGKKKASEGDTIEEKFKRTVHQVESLKDQLVLRRDIARQALLVKEEWKARLQVLTNDLKEEQAVKKSIHSDMTRQYKTMRSNLDLRVHQLEIEVGLLQQQLTSCQQQLAKTREEKAHIISEKDSTIKELQMKIDNMETEYEAILHDSLDLLLNKMEKARLQWEKAATNLHSDHKQKLLEFGLNPLDI